MALTLKEAFDSTFHEKYCFSDFLVAEAASLSQRFSIAGEHHDERAYYRPTKTLKTYSRFLNQFVFSHALVAEEVVFSYRKDTSVLQALNNHAGNTCFFKSDLTNFFESISVLDIVKLLKNRLAASPISDLCEHQFHIQRLILIDQRLPIGLPTSPLISNSILYDFDMFFAQWAQDHKVTYTRYSDDLIFSAQTDTDLKSLPSLLDGWLSAHYEGRFRLNPQKTYFTHSGQKVKLLGLVLLPNGHVTVSRQLKNQIETVFHYYLQNKAHFPQLVGQFFGDATRLMGVLHYVQTVDKGYVTKLRKKYGNYLVDLFFQHGTKL